MKHRIFSRTITPLLCSLGIASSLLINVPVNAADPSAVVPSDEAGKNAFVVNKGMKWHTSLEEAQAKAKQEGKLVFWVHMLGTMDGAT